MPLVSSITLLFQSPIEISLHTLGGVELSKKRSPEFPAKQTCYLFHEIKVRGRESDETPGALYSAHRASRSSFRVDATLHRRYPSSLPGSGAFVAARRFRSDGARGNARQGFFSHQWLRRRSHR